MRIHRIGLIAALLLATQLLGTGCILIPKIADRVVSLVTGGSIIVPLHAGGSTNLSADAKTINLRDSLDIAAVLKNAGVDADSVTSITVQSVQWRIVNPDPTAGRTINGSILVGTGALGATSTLISNFSGSATAVTGWQTATLNSAGMSQLNLLLAAILTELHGGAMADERISYAESGTSSPTSVNTNFDYEVKLTLSIVGKVKTKVLTGS
jgi:hypothetical protein